MNKDSNFFSESRSSSLSPSALPTPVSFWKKHWRIKKSSTLKIRYGKLISDENTICI